MGNTKRLLALLLLSMIVNTAGAQTYVRESVTGRLMTEIDVCIFVEDDGRITDYVFELAGWDARYSNSVDVQDLSIDKRVVVFRGSASEMTEFLREVLAFIDKYKDYDCVGTTIRGTKLEVFGGKRNKPVMIYSEDAYIRFNYSAFDYFIKGIEDYCRGEENDLVWGNKTTDITDIQ